MSGSPSPDPAALPTAVPVGESASVPTQSIRKWQAIARGLRLIGVGSVILGAAVLLGCLKFFWEEAVQPNLPETVALRNAPLTSQEMSELVNWILMAIGGVGIVVRIAGLGYCTDGPAESRAKDLMMGAFVCEFLFVLGPSPIAGTIMLFLFLHQVGRICDAPGLCRSVRVYSIGLGLSAALFLGIVVCAYVLDSVPVASEAYLAFQQTVPAPLWFGMTAAFAALLVTIVVLLGFGYLRLLAAARTAIQRHLPPS